MSVDIWPPIAPEQLRIEEDATQARELAWLLTTSLRGTLRQLRHGLEDSYALLAPVDPGSTLVLTTPRHETVKGHVTRVGTRLVRGAVSLRLRTLPPLTLALSPGRPLRLQPLQALHGILTRAVDLLRGLCDAVGEDDGEAEVEGVGENPNLGSGSAAVAGGGGGKEKGEGEGGKEKERKKRDRQREIEIEKAPYLAERLRVLAQQLVEASRIIKGSPSPTAITSSPSASTTVSSSAATSPDPSSSPSPATHSQPRPHPQQPQPHPQSQPPQLPSHPTPPDALRQTTGGTGWTTHSASLTHFNNNNNDIPPFSQSSHNANPPPPRNISVYLTIEDASLVLYVRALEPANAPMNLGAKLALAIGTARRIEHDEAERVFRYACDEESKPGSEMENAGNGGNNNNFLGVSGSGFLGVGSSRPSSSSSSSVMGFRGSRSGSVVGGGNNNNDGGESGGVVHEGEQPQEREEKPRNHHVDVYVREKVRVESADPSLLSLSAKLLALSNTLALARRNLAAVMGEEFEDYVV